MLRLEFINPTHLRMRRVRFVATLKRVFERIHRDGPPSDTCAEISEFRPCAIEKPQLARPRTTSPPLPFRPTRQLILNHAFT